MTKAQFIFYILVSIVFFYGVGYAAGSTKVLLFHSTSDGINAYVNVCDIDPEYRDENDNCRNYNKVKIALGKATDISGRRWASYGAGLGFLVGFALADYLEKRYMKQSNRKS